MLESNGFSASTRLPVDSALARTSSVALSHQGCKSGVEWHGRRQVLQVRDCYKTIPVFCLPSSPPANQSASCIQYLLRAFLSSLPHSTDLHNNDCPLHHAVPEDEHLRPPPQFSNRARLLLALLRIRHLDPSDSWIFDRRSASGRSLCRGQYNI